MVNTAQRGYTRAPIYSAIYGGMTLQFGFQYFSRQDAGKALPWRAKVGRNFLWGGQLGWVGAWILDSGLEKEAGFLRDLAQCRERVRPFFTYGRMLRPPEIADAPTLSVELGEPGKTHRLELPSVMASAWKLRSELLVALVNLGDEAAKAQFSLSRAENLLIAKKAYRMSRVTAKGEEVVGKAVADPIKVSEEVPPRSGMALVFRPDR